MSRPAGCPEFRQAFSRRTALQLGVLGGLGLTLPNLLASEAFGSTTQPTLRAKNAIMIWLQGGVSHHDTFDMKPDASAEVRGEFSPIATNVSGLYISELLPRLAQTMDRIALIRSCTHSESAHQRGSMYMVQGRKPVPGALEESPNPDIGSMISHKLGMQNGVPAYVSNPGNDFTSRFTGPGVLPRATAPFRGIDAPSLSVPSGFSSERFQGRLSLLESMDRLTGATRKPREWDRFSQQAVDIIASDKAAQAFDLGGESDETKRLYGMIDASGKEDRRHQLGKLTLQSRRLVEAGVRFVTIGRNSWDHHSNIFPQLKSRVPSVDAAFSGLVLDLEQRGLLDETLVIYSTEFGRTPKVNSQAGRDHWPRVFSVAFAGAGIRPGVVLGSSDKQGGEVAERGVSPEEIACTILHLMGIHPQSIYYDQSNRPIRYIDHGEPIREVLA